MLASFPPHLLLSLCLRLSLGLRIGLRLSLRLQGPLLLSLRKFHTVHLIAIADHGFASRASSRYSS